MLVKQIIGKRIAPILPNGRYQKLQLFALSERSKNAVDGTTTSSTGVVATQTIAPDTILTILTISCCHATSLFSYFAFRISTSLIFDYVKSILNLLLNFYSNLFCKLYFSILILFLEIVQVAKPHLYITQLSHFFVLRFLKV